MNKNFVKKCKCPYCSHEVDSAINEYNETVKPVPGDITMCIKCGEISEFDNDMDLIKFNVSKLNPEDIYDIRLKQCTVAKIHYKESKLQ